MRGSHGIGVLGAIVCALAVSGAQASSAAGSGARSAPSAAESPGSAGSRSAAKPNTADPLQGWSIFRTKNTPAAGEAASFRARGMAHDAQLLERISRQPIATWLTNDAIRARRQVSALTTEAGRHGAAAVLVVYDIPGRNCYEGVAASEHAYLRWIGEIAAGIGERDTIVILEPDAIPLVVGGCPIRTGLMADAVGELVRAAGARVYIDAGNPSWVTSVGQLAAPLIEAGIRRAAGFSLNVANFQTNAANIAYGHALSRLLGGAHFVIDTSRNGNGPEIDPAGTPIVCDPPGRALGTPPTTSTGVAGLDAYLWVKPPGASDGSCRPGAPPSGGWWLPYALELAADAP